MTEEWRDIPGFEGWYQASSRGRICGAAHCHIRKYGGSLSQRADATYLRLTGELPAPIAA